MTCPDEVPSPSINVKLMAQGRTLIGKCFVIAKFSSQKLRVAPQSNNKYCECNASSCPTNVVMSAWRNNELSFRCSVMSVGVSKYAVASADNFRRTCGEKPNGSDDSPSSLESFPSFPD